MTIKAWLDGAQPDLEELARLWAEGDVRIARDTSEDAYYLTAPEISNPPDTNRFDIPAEILITRINGLARARNADFRPVNLIGRYTTPDGRSHHFAAVNLELRLSIGMDATGSGTNDQPGPAPPSPWHSYLAAAESCLEVAEVLAIMGRGEKLGWVDLYKVYELIRRAIKRDTIVIRGWATDTEESAFTASANRPDVSGEDARHAVPQGAKPPQHTMTIKEGRSFISALVTNWLANP
jgi:hypothetical protein